MAEAGEAYLKLAPNTYTTTLKIQLMPSGYKTLEETNIEMTKLSKPVNGASVLAIKCN